MARPFPNLVTNNHFPSSSLPLTIGIFVSIFALVALCAKGGRRSRKESRYNNTLYEQHELQAPKQTQPSNNNNVYKTPPRSPLANTKKLLSNFSNIKGYNNNNNNNNNKNNNKNDVMVEVDHQNEGFGEGGLWQKGILMGEKCQPLEFSGVIYYDNYGNMTNQPPKSPRASIAASLQGTMSYPVSSRSSSDFN